ncbi:MAG: HAMP domain-containing sensor histidine kinase [Pseudomonadota bacterium]
MTPAEAAPERRANPHASRRGPGRSIVVQLAAALLGLALLVAALGALTVWGVERALEEVDAAEQSLVQIENARAIEAAYNRYLLAETRRRLGGGGRTGEHPSAGALRGALLAHRAVIAGEIESARTDEERNAERREMIRANGLMSLFETIETEAMFDRIEGRAFETGRAAQAFTEGIAAPRDASFRRLVAEVLEDERAEAVAAFQGLDRLRERLAWAWGGIAFALVLAAAAFALIFYRGLMRPIASLAGAAEALGMGAGDARVPEKLPGEFARLARRFNAMAGRIEDARTRLEAKVAARTAELEAANAELRAVDSARRRFFANVSHELRTPVTVLLGEAQLALRGGGERAALERIAASGGFLRRRLDDLMRLARSEDGQLALRMGDADLARAVDRASGTARAYAAASEIALVEAPLPEADFTLTGDEEALTQAALALIDNAIKFTPPGGRVAVSLEVEADGRIGFAVCDTGPGFEGDPAVLFDAYAQEGTGRAAGGSGLGLAIVRWIAEAHGGTVTATAGEAEGAVVRVSLPGRASRTHKNEPDDGQR